MRNLWLKFWLWIKIILLILVLVYLGVFSIINAHKTVTVWVWFFHEPRTSVLYLIASMLVAGILLTLLCQTGFKTARQIRGLRDRSRIARQEREAESSRAKAARLRVKPPASDSTMSVE